MALFYGSLAYLVGVALGRWGWAAAGYTCPWPPWLWLAPITLLPLTPLLNRWRRPSAPPALRWPVAAGFTPPSTGGSPALAVALGLCCLAGSLRYAGQPYTPCWISSDLAYYNLAPNRAYDRSALTVNLTGFVASYPTIADDKQQITLCVTGRVVDGEERPVHGLALLKIGIGDRYAYGQPLRVSGRLTAPSTANGTAYRESLQRRGIHSELFGAQVQTIAAPRQGNLLLRWLFAVRAKGEDILNRSLPEPYAALANGMLLGIEAGIPKELYGAFNATGSSHVIVISGSNVAIIAGALMGVGARLLGRRRALWPTLAGLACYALLVGGDAAVIRASIMGGLVVVAVAVNRRSTALVSLAAASACMVLLNPLMLWDVGLQLSSIATAGLILLVPPYTHLLHKFLHGVGWTVQRLRLTLLSTVAGVTTSFLPVTVLRAIVEEGLVVSLAANVMTMPLILLYFDRFSVVGLLTNLLIVPVQPMIMLAGFLGVLAGAVGLGWIARLLLWLPYVGLVWTVGVVQWTASFPGANRWLFGFGPAWLAATYGAIFVLRWRTTVIGACRRLWVWLQRDWWTSLIVPTATSVLGVAAILIWWAALSQPDGRLHVWFLDVGQGDGILIQTPSGRQVLVDGGAKPQRLFSELAAVMPFWDRTIDLVVLTHPDADHMAAQAEAPTRFAIDTAWDTAAGQANQHGEPWRARMREAGVAVQVQSAGGWVDLGDGATLWVLGPPAAGFTGEKVDNDNSLVTKLVYGNLSVLFTGDAGSLAEQALLATHAPLTAIVLKVGHHGSQTSTSPAFVRAVNPPLVVIQVGQDNTYGHPDPELLERLAGRRVLRTDQNGRIEITSDGQQMWVATQAN